MKQGITSSTQLDGLRVQAADQQEHRFMSRRHGDESPNPSSCASPTLAPEPYIFLHWKGKNPTQKTSYTHHTYETRNEPNPKDINQAIIQNLHHLLR